MLKDKENLVIVPVTIALKPALTEHHKMQRIYFCCHFANPNQQLYHHFYDHVHVDEKWFFISEDCLRYYIASDEERPERFVQNKDHITKVMFLAAVARPRYNDNGECIFDGKIGMWPFVAERRAQRRSVNRPAGAILIEPVSCTKERYREMMIRNVLPAIKRRWPVRNQEITIQQDGVFDLILG